MKLLNIIAFLFCSSLAFAQNTSIQDTSWRSISRKGYRVSYPSSWRIDTSRHMGIDIFFVSPVENQTDKFRDNLNVLVQDLRGEGISLDSFVVVSQQQVMSLLNEGRILQNRRVSENGLTYHLLSFIGVHGQFHLQSDQYYFMKDETFYVVTFTVEEGKQHLYGDIEGRMIASFRL